MSENLGEPSNPRPLKKKVFESIPPKLKGGDCPPPPVPAPVPTALGSSSRVVAG